MKGSGVVFTHGEGISTPHVRLKGRQPLIECANMTLIFMFPFLHFYVLRTFLYFSLFCGRQGCFPLLLRIPQFGMRKSDSDKSNWQNKEQANICLMRDAKEKVEVKSCFKSDISSSSSLDDEQEMSYMFFFKIVI